MVQSVTYTHLDGTTMVYTANVLTNTANVAFANAGPTANSTVIATLSSQAESIETLANGVMVFYKTVHTYTLDHGLNTWAKERLSAEDYQTFLTHAAIWKTEEVPRENANFNYWWALYLADQNVTYVE
jgi:hypothetical protein